ncbi:MAG: alpha-isopropylmalate synthase regulatory domain-containing protein, partial [Shimia sp.]
LFVRMKDLADRKKEVDDEDLHALMRDEEALDQNEHLRVVALRVTCGTDGPQEAALTLWVDGEERRAETTGNGPVDATFNAVKALHPHGARLELYQVHAVTEGTDAQATVSVRMSEEGRIATGQSADPDTVVASAKAYVNALNRLIARRATTGVGYDEKGVSYKEVG